MCHRLPVLTSLLQLSHGFSRPIYGDSLMILNVSQESLIDDSILTKGPDLHSLQPGNIVAFQDWYSLPQSERDGIDASLHSRGLKLLPFDEEQFHVVCYDTSPKL